MSKKLMRFSESSINRILYHGENSGIVIISACRGSIDDGNLFNNLNKEYTKWLEENDKPNNEISKGEFLRIRNNIKDKELRVELENLPYVFIPVYGGYVNKAGTVESRERSYIVLNSLAHNKEGDTSWYDLYDRALDWCAKYKQESVYIQPPHENPRYEDRFGKIVGIGNKDNFDFNVKGAGYTSVRRQRTSPKFTADISLTENLIRNNYRKIDE